MIDLYSSKKKIQKEILDVVDRFKKEHGEYSVLGIYCCPWSGWISICFNVGLLSQKNNNCPDFDFVEYRLIEMPEWKEVYDNNGQINVGKKMIVEVGDLNGDEEFNRIFFEYIKDVVREIRVDKRVKKPVLVQMLDSEMVELIDDNLSNQKTLFTDCIVRIPSGWLSFLDISKKMDVAINKDEIRMGKEVLRGDDILKIEIPKKSLVTTKSNYGIYIQTKTKWYFIFVRGLLGYPNVRKTDDLAKEVIKYFVGKIF